MHIDKNPLQASIEELRRWGVEAWFTGVSPALNRLPVKSETRARSDKQVGFYHLPSKKKKPFELLIFRSLLKSLRVPFTLSPLAHRLTPAFLKMCSSLRICSPLLYCFFQFTAWPNHDNGYRGV